MPEYQIRICSDCEEQVRWDNFFERWMCPNHGRHCTIKFLIVVPAPSPTETSEP